MKVKLTRAQKIKLANSKQVYQIMRDVLMREATIDRSKEHFWIVCLAHNNKLLLIELVCFGGRAAVTVEPTEVFSFALQKKASKMIMVHNHPHGELTPSFKDKELTERMAAIGDFVKVPVIDHLIITDKKYFSFTDSGLLEQIMAESHYDLTFSQIDRLKDQMQSQKKSAEKKLERESELRKKAEKEVDRLRKLLRPEKGK